eukprot:scaffold1525_cov142-Cylindrotheca_fusiformis.AAC.22
MDDQGIFWTEDGVQRMCCTVYSCFDAGNVDVKSHTMEKVAKCLLYCSRRANVWKCAKSSCHPTDIHRRWAKADLYAAYIENDGNASRDHT